MSECKKVKPIEVCPVCSKGESEEIAAALAETISQIERLKRQARVWKNRLRSIERKAAKARTSEPAVEPEVAAQ